MRREPRPADPSRAATCRNAALAVVLVAAALAALVPAPAGAQRRLGTNLATHVPNASFDCRWRPSTAGPQFFGFPDNCTYLSATPGAQSTGAPFPGGVVTSVRVRAAAPVGPMRVTVVRAISSTSGFACCFFQGESGTFVPRPNSITRVGVRLPVANFISTDPPLQSVDYLALTVLANNVAIPGQYPGNNELEGSLGFFPRIRPQDAANGRVDGYGNSLIPLLDATFTPLCRGGAGRAPTRAATVATLPAPPPARRGGRCLGGVTIAPTGSLSSSSAGLPLTCNLTTRCRGRLTLRDDGTRLGGGSFKLRSGKRKRVRAKLNDAGRRLARGTSTLRVQAKAKVKRGPGASRRVKLKR